MLLVEYKTTSKLIVVLLSLDATNVCGSARCGYSAMNLKLREIKRVKAQSAEVLHVYSLLRIACGIHLFNTLNTCQTRTMLNVNVELGHRKHLTIESFVN